MAKRRVRAHRDFRADVRRNLAWLAREGRDEWVDGLWDAIETVGRLLVEVPEIGPIVAADDRIVVRRIVVQRIPMIVHYAYRRRDPIGDVWLLRLFGSRQRRLVAMPRGWKRR